MLDMAMDSSINSNLQLAVQSVQWTYSIFWQLCPEQRILTWRDGCYNGAIKTRKTVQTAEISTEDECIHRSQQLRELYESLSNAGDTEQPIHWSCTALLPEDLSESEWFYLMCFSFAFPPSHGLPGKAFETQQPVWLTHANEADSHIFGRSILAKSAHIQTVVCIPVMHGVIELGTQEHVDEDIDLIRHLKSFFIDHSGCHPKPALSEQSTSNPTACVEHGLFNIRKNVNMINPTRNDSNELNQEKEKEDIDDEDNEIEQASERMQIETCEDIHFGSQDGCSNNLNNELQMLDGVDDSFREWHHLNDDICGGFPELSGSSLLQELSTGDSHYSETVSMLLHRASNPWSGPNTLNHFVCFQQSAFSKWNVKDSILHNSSRNTSQNALKYILLSVPTLYNKDKINKSLVPKEKIFSQEKPSANHVLTERKRREKLNERFIILRSLVPFVTKMDKASILGDTIEYVKQLTWKIQELESQTKSNGSENSFRPDEDCILATSTKSKFKSKEKAKAIKSHSTNLHVTIIEKDALIELQCPYKEGLILQIMQTLDKLGLEITSIKSTSDTGFLKVELRAKVKDINGEKGTIIKVKKAIYHIFSQ